MNRTRKIIFTLLGICLGAGLVVLGLNYAPQLSSMSKSQEEVLSGTQENLLPEIEHQESPIEFSSIAKSCTTQEKVGAFPDGLGGAGFPEIFFQDGKLMIGYWQEGDILDSRPFDWENEEDLEWYHYSGARVALELAAQTNLLEKLDYAGYDDGQLYCIPTDEDCPVTYEAGAWSDSEGNYFVAGYQKGKNQYKDLVYLINGKLYSPARQTTFDYHRAENLLNEDAISTNSHWFFGGFRDGKLLIKRYLDYKYVGGFTSVILKTGPQNWNTSTYTLETCEIDL